MGTAPEQKTESAKNGKDSMSLPFFQSLRVQQVAPTSLCKGGKIVYLYYSARFIRFIDSLGWSPDILLNTLSLILNHNIYQARIRIFRIFQSSALYKFCRGRQPYTAERAHGNHQADLNLKQGYRRTCRPRYCP